jgi:hypothetical protein
MVSAEAPVVINAQTLPKNALGTGLQRVFFTDCSAGNYGHGGAGGAPLTAGMTPR